VHQGVIRLVTLYSHGVRFPVAAHTAAAGSAPVTHAVNAASATTSATPEGLDAKNTR